MVITLTGDNSYELQRMLNGIISDFTDTMGDFGIERLDGEEVDFNRLHEAVTSLPFLTDKKLVILYAPSKNKQFIEKAAETLKDASTESDVVIVEPKLDKRLAYYKFLKANTDYHELNTLDQNGLAQWLVSTTKDRKGTLSLADARYLVNRVGANQQLVFSELEKLLLYDTVVSRKTIDLLTDETPQSTIFQLLEAAFSGNKKLALELYDEQRAMKVEPPQIIAMLAWQLHIVAIIIAARSTPIDQIARDTKINPYVLRKSSSIARHLNLKTLKRLIAGLLKIDMRLKTEPINPDEVLKNYLFLLNNVDK